MVAKQSLTDKYGITAADQQVRLSWVQVTDEDLERIRAAAEFLRPESKDIVVEFYDHSVKFPQFMGKLEEAGSNRQTLEGAQEQYFLRLLDGRIDDSYFENRLVIGDRHAILDVKPRWNVGNYATYAGLIFPRMAQHLEGEELANTLASFMKVFVLDISLAIEAYVGGLMDRLVQVNGRLGPSASVRRWRRAAGPRLR